MGVIYRHGDDLRALLVPFMRRHGSETEFDTIRTRYIEASHGRITAARFWTEMGLDPAIEDEFLGLYELTRGLMEFLGRARDRFAAVGCLSNDVSEWAVKRAALFGIDDLFDAWIISGDVNSRKPDAAIYQAFLDRTGAPAAEIVFVDDRPVNLDGAAAAGMTAVLYNPGPPDGEAGENLPHPVITSLEALLSDPAFG